MNEQIKVLTDRVTTAEKQLEEAKDNLAVAEALPENNVFEALDTAEGTMYERLADRAGLACEGSYNCGKPQYIQMFYVKDKLYMAVADVEYNRHDKTYYYVDEFDFRVEEVQV